MTGTRSRAEETDARRRLVVGAVAAADPSLPLDVVTGVVEAAGGAALRVLAAALAADPSALAVGAPPAVGRLVTALVAAGSTLPAPTCAICARVGVELTRDENGAGLCPSCRHRQLATACARCGIVKPVGGRDGQGQPVCARCSDRPARRCGVCGTVRRIGRRAHDGQPDICVNCYRLPEAICAVCRRRRPCSFARTDTPICASCAPRRTASCARCGQDRPPAARWREGPVCDPCYTAALRHRGRCASCGTTRRLVHPPGPDATVCAGCAGLPASHACADCGIEDKLFTAGRCASCTLRDRSAALLAAGTEQVPTALTGVHQAICAAPNPHSALNWLRTGAAAGLLADLAAGRLPATHDTLDAHPRRAAADYLRALLVAHQVLPARDDALARAEQRLTAQLATVDPPEHRRILTAYTTWRVLHRLRRRAKHRHGPRTWTRHAETRVHIAIRFLGWLHDDGTTLADLDQTTLEVWLTTAGPAAADIRDFLDWAAARGHSRALTVPTSQRRTGPATSETERIALLARLLHDDTLELTDRVAGALLLLYGQQLSRITALTTGQITQSGDTVHLQFGTDRVALPTPLAGLVLQLRDEGRPYTGLGAAPTGWLFPGLLAGQPMNPNNLGARLRKLGVHATAGRRAALTHLAGELPAAILADLISLHPVTAARWTSDTGGTWNRYAAALVQDRITNPDE